MATESATSYTVVATSTTEPVVVKAPITGPYYVQGRPPPHCPTCTCGRRKYASNAEKQAAYRKRKKGQ